MRRLQAFTIAISLFSFLVAAAFAAITPILSPHPTSIASFFLPLAVAFFVVLGLAGIGVSVLEFRDWRAGEAEAQTASKPSSGGSSLIREGAAIGFFAGLAANLVLGGLTATVDTVLFAATFAINGWLTAVATYRLFAWLSPRRRRLYYGVLAGCLSGATASLLLSILLILAVAFIYRPSGMDLYSLMMLPLFFPPAAALIGCVIGGVLVWRQNSQTSKLKPPYS